MEALAACCFIVGLVPEGHALLAPFGWGKAFWEINSELFGLYSKCTDSKDVVQCQNKYLEEMERTYIERRTNQSDDLMSRNLNHVEDLLSPSSESETDDVDEIVEQFDKLGNSIPNLHK